MAEGLLNHYCPPQFQAQSAGIQKTKLHPLAVTVMNEIGIDISKHYSKHLDEINETDFDIVVTVCDQARESCPFFPGKNVMHKGFADPSSITGSTEEKRNAFRKSRDEIKHWIINTFCPIQDNTED